MTYHTPANCATTRLDIKKSQFLAYAYPINSRDDVNERLQTLKKTYPDARHICYGYIIGDPMNTTACGFSDDGEPNGTAGRPILNVLQHKAIGNCAVFVVRYFGGIKLGAGGLTRAYGDATTQVVAQLTLTPFIAKTTLKVCTDFANEQQIRHIINELKGEIWQSDYTNQVTLTLVLRQESIHTLKSKIGHYAHIDSI